MNHNKKRRALKWFTTLTLIILQSPVFAQNATNFECKDCAENSHSLFAELDQGKVIVITWVMPCGTCLGPAITASTAVADYAVTHPGKVVFYLVDDYANTSCTSLIGWASNNDLEYDAAFVDESINMDHYGVHGMPKTVVISGTDGKVIFNENDDITLQAVKDAIQQGIWYSTGIKTPINSKSLFSVYPNPVQTDLTIRFSVAPTNGKVYLTNLIGDELLSSELTTETVIDLAELPAGVYLLQMMAGGALETKRITVVH